MLMHFWSYLTVALAAAFAARPGTAPRSAVIVHSGSTNTPGFKIVVERSGTATYTQSRRANGPDSGTEFSSRVRELPNTLVRRFYTDLEAAKPLSTLPRHPCMKSASFGTTLSIEFSGQTSPDL